MSSKAEGKRDRLRGLKVDKVVVKRETKPRADTRLGSGHTRPKGASKRCYNTLIKITFSYAKLPKDLSLNKQIELSKMVRYRRCDHLNQNAFK